MGAQPATQFLIPDTIVIKNSGDAMKKCFCFWMCATLLMLAAPGAIAQRTLYVSQNSPTPASPYATWDTAAHAIQEAVDAAGDGDTVLVAEGEYLRLAQITG